MLNRDFSFQCLGNHEFDEGVIGLQPFIRNLTSPILAANVNFDEVPELINEPNIHKSIILQIGDTKIGIIGYLTPETKVLAPKNKVIYEDEVTAIQREVEILKKQDVHILIALGHSGFLRDLNIAENVNDLDLVIGGHSNTFLWNANKTEEKPENPQGTYPTVVTQASGRNVLVVQAYAFSKYLGQLHLVFNSSGEIIKYDGEPLLLDQQIPEDPELLKKVQIYSEAVNALNNENIGESLEVLDGICRLVECNLGNLIADSVLNYTKKYYSEYSDVNIAVIQGGRIRTSIHHAENPIKITRGEVMSVLPFTDMLAVVTMNGTLLRKAMEHSVSTWNTLDSTGQFLQMSGMQVTYDLAQPPGSRVTELKAICSNCGNYNLSETYNSYEYKMFMPLFLADGGDGYSIFIDLPKDIVPFTEIDCVIDYIKEYSPIQPKTNGRITLVNRDNIAPTADTLINTAKSHFSYIVLEIITITILFLCS